MSGIEDRLVDALAARAELEHADERQLRRRRQELAAAAADDVTGLDAAVDDDVLTGVTRLVGARARRRRRVAAAVAAAAAAVLAAVAAGALLLVPGGTLAPAARTAQEAFPDLTVPSSPQEERLPSDVTAPQGLVPGTERQLLTTAAAGYWIAPTAGGQVCLLVVVPGQVTGSTCGRPWERGPMRLEVTGGGQRVDVALVAPGTDTRALTAEGWLPLAPEVWASPETARSAARADVLSATGDTVVAGPVDGEGPQQVVTLTDPGEHVVLLRCLTEAPVQVLVDGVPVIEPLCDGRWTTPAATVAGWATVRSSPVVVQVDAPAGAAWEAGVVRCSTYARQCPSVPVTGTGTVGSP